jgi:uncharacterized protein (TIGR02270 family)
MAKMAARTDAHDARLNDLRPIIAVKRGRFKDAVKSQCKIDPPLLMARSLILDGVVSQYAEEAAFLWLLRDAAVWAPQYTVASLARLDERIDAQLDGLRLADGAGWTAALGQLATYGEAGEVFASAVLAFESGTAAKILAVLDVAMRSPELGRALVSALGWLPLDLALDPIEQLLSADSPVLRRFGVAGAAIHRHDARVPLARALADPDPMLRGRACQAAGELGLRELRAEVRDSLDDEDDGCRFAAARAAALLGDQAAVRVLGAFAATGGPFADEACALGLRLFDEATAHAAHSELAQREELRRMAIIGAGAAGYGSFVPWILAQMHRPGLARVAGEAFTAITGVDLATNKLEAPPPEDFEAGPTEDPADEQVALDVDEHLPWPMVARLHDWWRDHRDDFHSDTRYLLGEPITEDSLWRVLQTGRQRYRASAAIELALVAPDAPLFEVRAPGFRQRTLLGV